MLTSLFVLFAATLVGSMVVPVLIGLAGAPGTFLAHSGDVRKASVRGWTGFGLAVLGQGYIGLSWTMLVCGYAMGRSEAMGLLGTAIVGGVGWLVAVSPMGVAVNDSDANVREGQTSLQDLAIRVVLPAAALAYPFVWFFPFLAEFGWSWVPTI